MNQRTARLAPWMGLALLLAVTAAAYQPTLDGGFVYDDDRVVVWNAELRQPDAVLLPGPRELLGTGRPLTSSTFALDLQQGLDARRFHRTGLILHLLVVATVFLLVRGLLRRVGHARPSWLALVVAALFALHPIQVESVAYVSQRSEVLSSLLLLWTLLLLDRAARSSWGWKGVLPWTASMATWVLAVAAKAIALSLPGLFVMEQLVLAPAGERGWKLARRRGARAVLLALPIALLLCWSALLHLASFEASPSGGAGFTATPLTPWQYLMTQFRVQWLYLRLLAWPAGLSIDRPFTPSAAFDASVAIAAAGVALLVALALWLWARAERGVGDGPTSRLVAFGILFWFIVLSPTSTLVPVLDLAVEHRVYLASVGPFLACAVAVDALLSRWLAPRAARVAATAVACAAIALLGVALHLRAARWSSPAGIWAEARALAPESPRVAINLGSVLGRSGDLRGAEEVFRDSWTFVKEPQDVVLLAVNHGALLLVAGRGAEALSVLDRAVPYAPSDPGYWSNRSSALALVGRPTESLADARRAAEGEPWNPLFRNLLGIALVSSGDLASAMAEFAAAESLDPGNPDYPVAAALALRRAGRRNDACAALHRASARARGVPVPAEGVRAAAELGCPFGR